MKYVWLIAGAADIAFAVYGAVDGNSTVAGVGTFCGLLCLSRYMEELLK